jgi:hypothetical protein
VLQATALRLFIGRECLSFKGWQEMQADLATSRLQSGTYVAGEPVRAAQTGPIQADVRGRLPVRWGESQAVRARVVAGRALTFALPPALYPYQEVP